MDASQLLSICEDVYDSADILAGPEGRDGARVYGLTDCCVVAFRGTLTEGAATFADWINDFHADLTSDARFPGRVHDGFLGSVTALWPALSGLLQSRPVDAPLWITGHSKGGAMAFLAAHLLAAANPKVVTFAAPRVGNAAFAMAYAVDTRRYENPADIVVRLPSWRYVPVGRQILAPVGFKCARGIRENHALKTGYKPWVA